jgi:hypothetical protein
MVPALDLLRLEQHTFLAGVEVVIAWTTQDKSGATQRGHLRRKGEGHLAKLDGSARKIRHAPSIVMSLLQSQQK